MLGKENSKAREIIEYAESKGMLVEKAALEVLDKSGSYREMIDSISAGGTIMLSAEDVENRLIKSQTKFSEISDVVIKKSRFQALAKDVDAELKIIKELDVTGQSGAEGSTKNFLRYFRDRYETLYCMLAQRPNLRPKTIDRLGSLPDNTDVDFIGMVVRKWKTKNGNEAFEVDDPSSSCIAVVSKENRVLVEASKHLLLDDVVAIKGRKISKGMVIVKELLWPDLENCGFKPVERDLSVIAVSDLHVGSKLFLEDEFRKFLSWLNGDVASDSEREGIGRIKYAVIAGDNVDGIGVYPDQFDELRIRDIYEQYALFAEYIKEIPEYIEVIICPGQHDAVRRADPQPAIPKEFVKELHGLGNIHFVGSPSWFSMEGLTCLLYHGACLHDLYNSVGFLNPTKPQEAMVELLKHRHLMPGYGLKQPYVPEKKDFMVIREHPDFYFGGDMHHNGYDTYKGCTVVNSGTWQKQTNFQIEQGHVPTPGIVPEISLKTRKIREKHFYAQRAD